MLLTDVVMPDMQGPELAERLRSVRPDLRVLFMSGYASSQLGGAALTTDSTHFIQKPFTMTELARSLERVLRPALAADKTRAGTARDSGRLFFAPRSLDFRARRALEGTMAIRLPLFRPELDPVDRIEIPTPCSVPWDSMYGDGRIRHCGSCRKNVYNVAELTRAQARTLIASREPVCLRIYRRPDGTVVTNDCWSRLRAARRRGMWAFLVMLVIVGWAQLAAMIVGLAGLRRLVLQPVMGGARPARTLPAPPRVEPPLPFEEAFPVPLPYLGELKGGSLMGGAIGTSQGLLGLPMDRPRHHEKTKPKKSEAAGHLMGRLGL